MLTSSVPAPGVKEHELEPTSAGKNMLGDDDGEEADRAMKRKVGGWKTKNAITH